MINDIVSKRTLHRSTVTPMPNRQIAAPLQAAQNADGASRSRFALWPFILAVALLLLCVACNAPSQQAAAPQGKARDAAIDKPQAAKPHVGFASRQKWIDHYRKHGREFGSISKEQYLLKAQELRDHPAGGDILEHVRPDGVITRFDRATGDFIAFNDDGVIRTYFRPNDGEAYFRRQARRRH
jgi:hypothetical protein